MDFFVCRLCFTQDKTIFINEYALSVYTHHKGAIARPGHWRDVLVTFGDSLASFSSSCVLHSTCDFRLLWRPLLRTSSCCDRSCSLLGCRTFPRSNGSCRALIIRILCCTRVAIAGQSKGRLLERRFTVWRANTSVPGLKNLPLSVIIIIEHSLQNRGKCLDPVFSSPLV